MRMKHCLTTTDVRRIADACRAEIEANDWAMTLAIVDDGGHLLHLERLDRALLAGRVLTERVRAAVSVT